MKCQLWDDHNHLPRTKFKSSRSSNFWLTRNMCCQCKTIKVEIKTKLKQPHVLDSVQSRLWPTYIYFPKFYSWEQNPAKSATGTCQCSKYFMFCIYIVCNFLIFDWSSSVSKYCNQRKSLGARNNSELDLQLTLHSIICALSVIVDNLGLDFVRLPLFRQG